MRNLSIKRIIPALALLGLLLLSSCGEADVTAAPENNSKDAVRVEVVVVQPTQMRDVLILPGEVMPWADVRVPADVAGPVESIEFKEGDQVSKGDLLAKIDVATLKAVLDGAQADLDMAQRVFSRRKELLDREIISKEEFEQARTNLVVRQNTVEQAKVQFAKGLVKAPIDGRINFIHVDAGEFVGAGDPVLDIVTVDRLKIELNVPELDVRFLEPGQQCLVRVDAYPDLITPAAIEFVAFKADSATKTFRTKVVLDNPNGIYRPGMIARVALIRRTIDNALTAPLFALVDKEGERLVFVEEDGVARARVISYGVIEGDRIQIVKGLEPGDRLIVTGQNHVEDGTQVESAVVPALESNPVMPGWQPQISTGRESEVKAEESSAYTNGGAAADEPVSGANENEEPAK